MVVWILFFVSCARGNYRHLTLQNLEDLGKETLGREFYPALLGVGYDVDTAEILSLDEQILSSLVQLFEMFLDDGRDRNLSICLQILVGSEDTGA